MNKPIRLAGPALAAAVVLLATGCGSSGDDDAAEDSAADQSEQQGTDGEDTGDADADGEEPGDDTGGTVSAELAGIWGSSSGGDTLLQIGSDGLATLITPNDACLGGAQEAAGQVVISLQCSVATEYNAGRAEVSGEGLTVAWDGGGQRLYERIADQAVDFADLDLGEFGLDELEGFDPGSIDFEGIDLDELESILPGGPGSGD
ncbi:MULTISPECIES: hypothetical protein [Streptomyces]|uniref:hypothetical protein n=1 Tax=Streptomyces TaxID=1883 RepID=UPI000CD5026E|nr:MULTISPECIES: hypothetical protein [Streptomyces]